MYIEEVLESVMMIARFCRSKFDSEAYGCCTVVRLRVKTTKMIALLRMILS